MCGIAGFYSIRSDQDPEPCAKIAQGMASAIAHRGPDGSGIWQDPDLNLTLAHRRLSIIDLSVDGAQPMVSGSGRYVVSYNGEIYNYQALQKDLQEAGCQFKGRSDTETMLAAFEHFGVNAALQKLNGMFAFALWDRKERVLHLVRDRFGKKPLYVGWVGRDLVFASELKALHAHPDFTPEIDQNALALYMRYGYVHAPYSIFKNIWQLLPAGRLTLKFDELEVGQDLAAQMQIYWSLKEAAGQAQPLKKTEAEIIQEFEEMLEQAVQMRMVSDVPLGAFLSGGIDSSSIVALMQKNADRPVKTFSVGFHEDNYNEAHHAKEIAGYLGTDHQEFYVSAQEAQNVIPDLPDMYDEPFADSSQIPTYLISKLARGSVTVALTGDGGDEILGGYERHIHIPVLWNKVGWVPHKVREGLFGSLQHFPESLVGTKVRRALSLMCLESREEIYEALVSAWPARENGDITRQGKLPEIPLTDQRYWPQRSLSFADHMMFGDMLSYRPNDVMVKTDRAGMAVSLEARAPLMDYKLAEYCWRLPQNMKVRDGQGKWLLRQVLKRHIPEKLYERPKMGFSVPIGTWLRGPLQHWAQDLLSEEQIKRQGLLDAPEVTKLWCKFQANETSQLVPKHLWSILMFQAWYGRWVKG
ncbi:MAG: asparagine synthase (glutamine-hydrolyzing) [Alphaproteobacteria bacterium]|nr:asparagine synthase (glutamine-hydrolyzing) [Alphaproteobacteria bacterium]